VLARAKKRFQSGTRAFKVGSKRLTVTGTEPMLRKLVNRWVVRVRKMKREDFPFNLPSIHDLIASP
jgi:molybdenum cofactor biosynthesis enzyme MoaA